jgi:hypothetical protein
MNRSIRWKLEMAARVLNWCQAHPDPGARATAAVARLSELLARSDALVVQQVSGRRVVGRSTVQRKGIRRGITRESLRHLSRIARAAATTQPGVERLFRIPRSANQKEFVAIARTMAAEAEKNRELFMEYGMTDEFLEGLKGALAAHDEALTLAHAGHRAHTGARADLKAVTDEIMLVVRDLDASQRYRFRKEPEQLASWEAARNIPWHNGGNSSEPPPEESAEGPAVPAA